MSVVTFEHYHERCNEHPEDGWICARDLWWHIDEKHQPDRRMASASRRVGPHG